MKKDLIIEKQREYIKHLKIQLKMKSPAIGTTSYNFESELSALESEPDEELFVKVYIRDLNDMPIESGKYGCVFNDNHFGEANYDTKQRLASESDIWWINKVKWYLKPLTAKQ